MKATAALWLRIVGALAVGIAYGATLDQLPGWALYILAVIEVGVAWFLAFPVVAQAVIVVNDNRAGRTHVPTVNPQVVDPDEIGHVP